MTPKSNGGTEHLPLAEGTSSDHGSRLPSTGRSTGSSPAGASEGPRLIIGHEWEESGELRNDWREICRTVIEYGRTEKRCVLRIGHEGPHVWGEEEPKRRHLLLDDITAFTPRRDGWKPSEGDF